MTVLGLEHSDGEEGREMAKGERQGGMRRRQEKTDESKGGKTVAVAVESNSLDLYLTYMTLIVSEAVL